MASSVFFYFLVFVFITLFLKSFERPSILSTMYLRRSKHIQSVRARKAAKQLMVLKGDAFQGAGLKKKARDVFDED